MPIHGLGVDILHVPRIASLVHRRGADRLAARILSSAELSVFRARLLCAARERGWAPSTRVAQFLGVRWAVKEAAYKALYPLRPTWKELTYASLDHKTGARPTLVFHPAVHVGPGACTLHVSVSHDGEYIVATVLAERAE